MSARTFVDAQLRALHETSLTGMATVTVVVRPKQKPSEDALASLGTRALAEGFAVTRASLAAHGLKGKSGRAQRAFETYSLPRRVAV